MPYFHNFPAEIAKNTLSPKSWKYEQAAPLEGNNQTVNKR